MYTIQELANRYHIQTSALRYYEEIGLLQNVGRNASNKRIYDDSHIARLDGVLCFKRTGMSIAQIQEFYKYESDFSANIDNILHLVQNHEYEIIEKIENMQKDLDHIREKIQYYSVVKRAVESNAPIPSWDDVIL